MSKDVTSSVGIHDCSSTKNKRAPPLATSVKSENDSEFKKNVYI
jgi:hypothetical protein